MAINKFQLFSMPRPSIAFQFPSNKSARDFNGFDPGFRFRLFRHCHSQHSVLHGSLNLFYLGIIRQSETAKEASPRTFNAMPFLILLFFFLTAFSGYLQNSTLFYLYFNLLFLQTCTQTTALLLASIGM
eukprot:Gb_37649 [translate_table: standard]